MVLAFIGGALLFPLIHKVESNKTQDSHQEDNCSVCQLAHTPIVTSVPDVTPVIVCASPENIRVLPFTPYHPDMIDSCLARGPPAA